MFKLIKGFFSRKPKKVVINLDFLRDFDPQRVKDAVEKALKDIEARFRNKSK